MAKEKKKVLHIVEAMGGGVFTFIVELANGMCEDFDITIAFGMREETPKNYKDFFDKKVKLIQVKNFTRGLNPMKDLGAYFELRRIIKEVKPDIIHTHSSKAGAIGRYMFNRKCEKMFYTPHGYSFLMEGISERKKKFYKTLEKKCGNKSNCITIACGESEWKQGRDVSQKSTYISNGINMKKMDKILEQPPLVGKNHPFTVYTLGRIEYQKNPAMFNEIAKRLPKVRFVWIGAGERSYELTEPNIIVTGWIHGEIRYEFANAGDVFLLPSRWEGLPLAVLEAMYMEKPCVVSNVVGNCDVIKNGVNGYICDTLDEFVDAIKKCEELPQIELVKQAKEDVRTTFNTEVLCRKYKEIYNGEYKNE